MRRARLAVAFQLWRPLEAIEPAGKVVLSALSKRVFWLFNHSLEVQEPRARAYAAMAQAAAWLAGTHQVL